MAHWGNYNNNFYQWYLGHQSDFSQQVLSIHCYRIRTFHYTGQTSACSQVLSSDKFHLFLTECEESVNKLMAEVATKFYNLGFQEGRQIAVKTTTSPRIVSLFSGGVVLYMQAYNYE